MPDTSTPYDDVFRTMATDCPFLLVPLINEAFGEQYTGNEKITLLQNEHFIKLTDGELKKKITDSHIGLPAVTAKTYHFECQSTADGEITIRIFEYASQMALESASHENGHLVLEYPHSAILYLRHSHNTPDYMKITIKTPDSKASYKVPVIKLQQYTLNEIFDKNLLFLIPFYIFSYEKEFPDMENGSLSLDKAEQEFTLIAKKLNKMCLDREITEYTKSMLSSMTKIVIKNIAAKYENIKKGLGDIMGGKVLEYEAKTILRKGIEQGMEKALVFMVVKKIKKGKDASVIADELDEDIEKINRIFHAALETAPYYNVDEICDILNQ